MVTLEEKALLRQVACRSEPLDLHRLLSHEFEILLAVSVNT